MYCFFGEKRADVLIYFRQRAAAFAGRPQDPRGAWKHFDSSGCLAGRNAF